MHNFVTEISHNSPFCSRNMHMCVHFCYKIVHCVWRNQISNTWLWWNIFVMSIWCYIYETIKLSQTYDIQFITRCHPMHRNILSMNTVFTFNCYKFSGGSRWLPGWFPRGWCCQCSNWCWMGVKKGENQVNSIVVCLRQFVPNCLFWLWNLDQTKLNVVPLTDKPVKKGTLVWNFFVVKTLDLLVSGSHIAGKQG